MSKNRALVFLGYVLESATPGEQTRFLRRVPPPVRLLYRLTGKRTYERQKTVLRAGLPDRAEQAGVV